MPSSFIRNTRRPLSALGGAASANLNFSMQPQQQSNWCWSAVATSTSLFYNTASKWTQCKLVNRELQQSTCCQNGSSVACNQPWYLDRALNRTGNLQSWSAGTSPFATVQAQINGGKALGARIGWAGGGGHFVVLDGYSNTTGDYVSVRDSIFGSSTITYAAFSNSYQGSGSWTHSYFTKP